MQPHHRTHIRTECNLKKWRARDGNRMLVCPEMKLNGHDSFVPLMLLWIVLQASEPLKVWVCVSMQPSDHQTLATDNWWFLTACSLFRCRKCVSREKKKKPWFKMANKLKVTLDINISLIKITTNHLFIQSLRVMKVNWFDDVHLLNDWTSLYKVFTWNTVLHI